MISLALPVHLDRQYPIQYTYLGHRHASSITPGIGFVNLSIDERLPFILALASNEAPQAAAPIAPRPPANPRPFPSARFCAITELSSQQTES